MSLHFLKVGLKRSRCPTCMMIHDLDIVLSLVKSKVKKVEALGVPLLTDKVDLANARLYFENEAVANLVASRVSLKEMRKIRFFQEGGYISLDTASNKVSISQMNQEKQLSYEEIESSPGDALEFEIKSFLHCITTRNTPEVSIDDAIASLSLARQIKDAIDKKLSRIQKKYHPPLLSRGDWVKSSKTILIVAGEASGDLYGAELLLKLKNKFHNLNFVGMGGENMAKLKPHQFISYKTVSVTGGTEVFKRIHHIFRAFQFIKSLMRSVPIDAAVLIDFPDFNFLLLKHLKRKKLKSGKSIRTAASMGTL